MNIFCGTDIIEIDRIKSAIIDSEENNIFVKKIYTKKEIEYCESKGLAKFQHYAARFAAKEATFKALSKLLDNKYELSWKDVEVVNDKNGRPILNIFNDIEKIIGEIDISLSHCKQYAIAIVVVETV